VAEAKAQGVGKKEATPFLLKRVFELTGGQSLEANIALIKNNVMLAAQAAVELARL
jgi:pseudouridylate synthase